MAKTKVEKIADIINQGTTGSIFPNPAKLGTTSSIKKSLETSEFQGFFGGNGGIRTHVPVKATAFRVTAPLGTLRKIDGTYK